MPMLLAAWPDAEVVTEQDDAGRAKQVREPDRLVAAVLARMNAIERRRQTPAVGPIDPPQVELLARLVADRPELALEWHRDLVEMMAPPGRVAGIENIRPRRHLVCRVDRDYAAGWFFAFFLRGVGVPFLPPGSDGCNVLSREARSARKDDDVSTWPPVRVGSGSADGFP